MSETTLFACILADDHGDHKICKILHDRSYGVTYTVKGIEVSAAVFRDVMAAQTARSVGCIFKTLSEDGFTRESLVKIADNIAQAGTIAARAGQDKP